MGLFNSKNKEFEKKAIQCFKEKCYGYDEDHIPVIKDMIADNALREDNLDEVIAYFSDNNIKSEKAGKMIMEHVKDFELFKEVYDYSTKTGFDHEETEAYIFNLKKNQRSKLLNAGELIIYVPHISEQTTTTMDMRPKGITDVIGGAYGQTSIRMRGDINTITSPTTKWMKDKLLLNDDGFTIVGTGETILFNHIASINVNIKTQSDMGLLVTVTLKNSNNLAFRTPITLGFETLIKEKIANQNTSEEGFTNNAKNHSSNADELMKYAELYEKGLLTEEEFNAMKKKLLGL